VGAAKRRISTSLHVKSVSDVTFGVLVTKKPGINRAFSPYLNFRASKADLRTLAVAELATATAASRARRDSGSFELLEVLEHADHGVTRRRVGLVRDRATKRDSKLRAELGLDQAIRAKRFLGIVVSEIGFAAGGSDPHGSESGSTTTGVRDRELFDRSAETLANQRHWRKSDETIVVVIWPTEDRACH
jgi:hypothetical protein